MIAKRFIKFCCVGGSGVLVDMTALALLMDPGFLGFNLVLSKACAAEMGVINNFVWNEVWTFRSPVSVVTRERTGSKPEVGKESRSKKGQDNKTCGELLKRFLIFHAICGAGVCISVLLLHLLHYRLGVNVYAANLGVVAAVSLWNYSLNARLNWRVGIEV